MVPAPAQAPSVPLVAARGHGRVQGTRLPSPRSAAGTACLLLPQTPGQGAQHHLLTRLGLCGASRARGPRGRVTAFTLQKSEGARETLQRTATLRQAGVSGSFRPRGSGCGDQWGCKPSVLAHLPAWGRGVDTSTCRSGATEAATNQQQNRNAPQVHVHRR